MTISQRIFQLLNEQNKTQKDLSKYTGISTSTISAWNTRGTNPSAETLKSISEFFGVSLEYLITGEESQNNTINTGNIQGNHNANININAEKNCDSEVIEIAELIKELPLTKRAEIIVMIDEMKKEK